jgi:hypothetical protein
MVSPSRGFDCVLINERSVRLGLARARFNVNPPMSSIQDEGVTCYDDVQTAGVIARTLVIICDVTRRNSIAVAGGSASARVV